MSTVPVGNWNTAAPQSAQSLPLRGPQGYLNPSGGADVVLLFSHVIVQ